MKIQKGKVELHAKLLEQGNTGWSDTFGKFVGALTAALEEKIAKSATLDDTLVNKTFDSLGLDPEYSRFVSGAVRSQVLVMLIHTWEHGEELRLVLQESGT